jgi:hypothetical protein
MNHEISIGQDRADKYSITKGSESIKIPLKMEIFCFHIIYMKGQTADPQVPGSTGVRRDV